MRTTTLLHTGLDVPAEPFLQVAAYNELTTSEGVAFIATVRIGPRLAGVIEQSARDPHPHFIPADRKRFGHPDFDRFVDVCRMDGKPVTAHEVLDWLVDEYTTSVALGAQLERGATLARQMADHHVVDWTPVPVPRDTDHRALVAARLDHHPDTTWQIWVGYRWEPLDTAPST